MTATMTPTQRAEAAARYVMPAVALGDRVIWYRYQRNDDPMVGLVTKVGAASLTIAVFPPASITAAIIDGARHVEDPEVEKSVRADNGMWDFHPDMLRLQTLEKTVQTLEATLAKLASRLATLEDRGKK